MLLFWTTLDFLKNRVNLNRVKLISHPVSFSILIREGWIWRPIRGSLGLLFRCFIWIPWAHLFWLLYSIWLTNIFKHFTVLHTLKLMRYKNVQKLKIQLFCAAILVWLVFRFLVEGLGNISLYSVNQLGPSGLCHLAKTLMYKSHQFITEWVFKTNTHSK